MATDADGLLDILTDNHDALIVPRRDAVALAEKIIWAMDRPEERARLGRCGASERTAIRHRRLRAEDGAPLHAPPRNLARDTTPGRASRGSVVSHLRGVRVIDAMPAGVPAGGAMRYLGAAVSAGLGVVLLAFATTIDFPKTAQGFKGDEATYYSLAHSLARDFDFTFERQRSDPRLGRVSRAGRDLPQAREDASSSAAPGHSRSLSASSATIRSEPACITRRHLSIHWWPRRSSSSAGRTVS